MKNDQNPNENNDKKENNETPPKNNTHSELPPSPPMPSIPYFEDTTDESGRVLLTNTEGVTIECFACYTEKTIEGVMAVLQAVQELMAYEDQEDRIEEGLEIAELTLQEYLEELRARHHGEGLPKGSIPVRPIPFVVPEKE